MLVHGGMAQDVGPILEMVTEKYLLRSEAEWGGRARGHRHPGRSAGAAARTAISAAIGACTERNFDGPIQTIIPWAGNLYTDTLIRRVRAEMGDGFLGLLDARRHVRRRHGLSVLSASQGRSAGAHGSHHERDQAAPGARRALRHGAGGLRFRHQRARHRSASCWPATRALLPAEYYTLTVPALLRTESRLLSPRRRAELDRFTRGLPHGARILRHGAAAVRSPAAAQRRPRDGGAHAEPRPAAAGVRLRRRAARADPEPTCAAGRIGLAQNRLPANSRIEDARPGRRCSMPRVGLPPRYRETWAAMRWPPARWRWSRWPAASAAAGPRARAW